MSAPTTTVTAAVTTTPAASNYYEFNHYSGQLHDWSMSCISSGNIGYAAVGLVTLVAATVARVFEGAIMGVLNFLLAVKYCICGAAEEVAPPAPPLTPPPANDTSTVNNTTGVVHDAGFKLTDRQAKQGFTAAVTAGGAGVAASYGVAAAGLTALGAPVVLPVAAALGVGYGAYRAAGKLMFPPQAKPPVTVLDAAVAGSVATQPSSSN